jgi:hypothetical protein
MPPFRYEAYQNPFAATIGEMMARAADPQARAAQQVAQAQATAATNIAAANARAQEIGGQAWAGAAQTIGHDIAQIPQQIQQRADQEGQRELRGQQMAMNAIAIHRAQRDEAGRQGIAGLMSGSGQVRPGDVGPQQDSYLDSNGLFDVKRISSALGQMGYGDMASDLVKGAESINDSILKHQSLEKQAAQQHAVLLGDMADGVLKLMKTGTPIDQAMDFVVQPALATKRIQPQEYAQVKQSILQMPPEQQQQALTALMDQSSKIAGGNKTIGKDTTEVDRYGRIVASNMVPDKPTRASLAADLSSPDPEVRATAQKALDALAPPPPSGKGLQSENALVDGKPTKVNFNPETGAYTLPGGEDVSSRVRPIPPQSAAIQPGTDVAIKPDSKEYRIAQDLAYGKLTFRNFTNLYPSRSPQSAAQRQSIYDTARTLNPQFDPSQFEAGFKLFTNPQIRQRLVAIDALGPVIDKIKDVSAKVGNGDVQVFNQILQRAKLQISNKPVASLQQLKTLLGDEIGLALGVGTGSDLKTKLGLDMVNPNLSPSAFAATMDQLEDIIQARRQALLTTMGPYGQQQGTPAAAPTQTAAPRTIRARDANGVLHEAPAGTQLPAGWTLER